MRSKTITDDMILDAALAILRSEGRDTVTVGRIAKELGCSVQPIYSCFGSMDGLWARLERAAVRLVHMLITSRIDPLDPFATTGRAYAEIAREEPHLFRVFVTARRSDIHSLSDIIDTEVDQDTLRFVADSLQLDSGSARRLYLNMLVYTLGLCMVYAVCEPGLEPEEVFGQMQYAFEAFVSWAKRG